jgi:energy-coupling factor transporter transmembrane protein EcfT
MGNEPLNLWLLVAALIVGFILGGQAMMWLRTLLRSLSQVVIFGIIAFVAWYVVQHSQTPKTAETPPEPEAAHEWWMPPSDQQ